MTGGIGGVDVYIFVGYLSGRGAEYGADIF